MAEVVFRKGSYTPIDPNNGELYVNEIGKTLTIGTASNSIRLTDSHLLRELCLGTWVFSSSKLFNYIDPMYNGIYERASTIQNCRIKYVDDFDGEAYDEVMDITMDGYSCIYFGRNGVAQLTGSTEASVEILITDSKFEILDVSNVSDSDIAELVELLDSVADKEIVNYNQCLKWQSW